MSSGDGTALNGRHRESCFRATARMLLCRQPRRRSDKPGERTSYISRSVAAGANNAVAFATYVRFASIRLRSAQLTSSAPGLRLDLQFATASPNWSETCHS